MRKKAIFVANTGFALFHFKRPIMRYLARSGWEVVCVAEDEADYGRKFAAEGIRFISVNIDHKGKSPLRDISFMLKLRNLYRREAPDLVQHTTIKPVIFGTLAAKWMDIHAVVNSIDGLGYVFLKGGWLKSLVMQLYRYALSGRSKVIFLNEDDYQYFVSSGIVRKDQSYLILGCGVDTRSICPAINRRYESGMRFVLISRMLWSKGIAEFVKAAEEIKKTCGRVEFFMAGGPSGGGAQGNPAMIPEEWLHRVNREGNVRWLGRLPFPEAMALLDKADVMVLPSYYPEGVPKSLIEAAAKGKAIITTNTPGCREVVEHGINGFLVPPKDVDALARSMAEFIRQPDLIKKMGRESRRRAEELFDEQIVLKKTEAVYRDAGVL